MLLTCFYVHHLQDLANILYTFGYVDEHEIRTQLEFPKEFEFTEIEHPKPGTGQRLQQREMGILVWRMEREEKREKMSKLATHSLGCSPAEVSNILSKNREDSWSRMFEILDRWSSKKRNTRKV